MTTTPTPTAIIVRHCRQLAERLEGIMHGASDVDDLFHKILGIPGVSGLPEEKRRELAGRWTADYIWARYGYGTTGEVVEAFVAGVL